MWDQYKRTFIAMQVVILLVTTAVFILSRLWTAAGTFFAIMQIGSVLGAVWGSNLRYRILAGQRLAAASSGVPAFSCHDNDGGASNL